MKTFFIIAILLVCPLVTRAQDCKAFAKWQLDTNYECGTGFRENGTIEMTAGATRALVEVTVVSNLNCFVFTNPSLDPEVFTVKSISVKQSFIPIDLVSNRWVLHPDDAEKFLTFYTQQPN